MFDESKIPISKPEICSEKLTITTATEDMRQYGIENCIVIKEGTFPTATEIMQMAIANKAFEDNSEEEAGDDQYAVQFPGHDKELLDYDAITARLRSLTEDDAE